jgi:hypothetical protein
VGKPSLINYVYVVRVTLATVHFRTFLSSCLPSKNLNTEIYGTVIFLVVWYEAWSVTLRKEYRLRLFDEKVVRRIFGPRE